MGRSRWTEAPPRLTGREGRHTNVFETREEPVLAQSLPISVEGERLLIFDDVVDSGKSLPFCKKYMSMCGACKITTATLFYKPWSVYKPDFFACQTEAWVIFPHEAREAIEDISKKWLMSGLTKEKIKKRFLKIGLPGQQIDFYLK